MRENPSKMQDILQIVVLAFLRMKQVKISPSCLFVHQNVGEVTAKDQNMEGRRRLEQTLDKMAAIAAEEEQCSDVTCFSDVISLMPIPTSTTLLTSGMAIPQWPLPILATATMFRNSKAEFL